MSTQIIVDGGGSTVTVSGSVTVVSSGGRPLLGGGVPVGGTAGQSLVKASDDDYDTEWATVSGGGGGGSGTVTSVALSLPAVFSLTGSPVTGAGAFTVTLATQAVNRVFAGPTSGSASAPTFRALVAADIPDLSATYATAAALTTTNANVAANASAIAGKQPSAAGLTSLSGLTGAGYVKETATGVFSLVSSVPAADVSGLVAVATSGSAADLGAGTLPDARLSNVIAAGGPTGSASVVPVLTYDAHGRLTAVSTATITPSAIGAQPLDGDLTALAALSGTNAIYYRAATNTWSPVTFGPGMTFTGGVLDSVSGGSGTVTSVGLTTPAAVLTVTGSPVTGSGTIAITLHTQAAAAFFAGPASGSAAAPTFRAIVSSDLPAFLALGDAATASQLVLNDGLGGTTIVLDGPSGQASVTGLLLGSSGPWTSFGTAATRNTGTSGAVVPMLSTANTWGAAQTFLSASGIKIVGATGSNTLGIATGSTYTANRTLTITTGDASRTVTLNGNVILSGTNTGDQDLSGYALLAGAAFTGATTGLTVASNDNSTNFATTAWVNSFVSAAVAGLLVLKGNLDCSANPNYPAGAVGDSYYVSVAGKVGGASGVSVDVSDLIVCKTANAGGTQAAVGSSWFVLEHNLVGALVAANNLSDVPSPATARTNLGVPAGSGTSAGTNTGDQFTSTTAKRLIGNGGGSAAAAGEVALDASMRWRSSQPAAGGAISTTATTGTANLDLNVSNIFGTSGATGNMTYTLSNGQDGDQWAVYFSQDATGSRTISWFGNLTWMDGATGVPASGANKRTAFAFRRVSSTDIWGWQSTQG